MSGYVGVLAIMNSICSRRMRGAIAKLRRNITVAGALRVGAALLFGVVLLPAHAQVADGYVGGMARESASGKPVAEVKIVAHNVDKGTDLFTVTDATGMYKFTNLEPGRYDVAAIKNGFQKASTTVDVEGKHLTRVDLPLEADASGTPDVPPTITKSNTEPLTEREKELLKRIDSLETRLAAMEAKGEAKPEVATQPIAASLNPAGAPATASTADPQQTTTAAATATPNPASPAATPAPAAALPQGLEPNEPTPGVDNQTPFAYGDFSWLNGTGRGTPAFDTKFFTPEIRFDTNWVIDKNHPVDHTLGGSTEEFRAGEVQVEQASFGGDFHWNNVRGRILTMFGEFATTTPRNDASVGVGQWDLQDAYRYFSEAWGGYHFNVNHGLNIDAGIFVSYIGLFSYYNFDNWTYQPSYVSSNTPWFFNGLRIQWFPTNKLKIEPWFINGWQSYNKYNSRPGLGGQILWRPVEWFSAVFNNYGMGTDTLGNPNVSRIHTDDSFEVRYFNRPDSTGLSKIAMSFTGDLGCQYGGGASCFKNTANGLKDSFAGWMLYNRFWFDKDKHAITIGGGQMDNPGGYLTLLPPIDGANAVSGSPYFTENFGQPFKMWDTTLTYNWMPKTWATWWAEIGYRHSDQNYWTGHGGITPPGGNTGSPANYVCTNGTASVALPSASPSSPTGFTPSGNGFTVDNAGGAVASSCTATFGSGWTSWFPDLVKDQFTFGMGIMVRF
jgi:Putative beta-barrel porin-2, OmpL-like. bbp2/Carboxypeptidase regulatory-like domain